MRRRVPGGAICLAGGGLAGEADVLQKVIGKLCEPLALALEEHALEEGSEEARPGAREGGPEEGEGTCGHDLSFRINDFNALSHHVC